MNEKNNTICRILWAIGGLCVCAMGAHCVIRADIGLGPWDALYMGMSYHLPITYGTACVCVALGMVGVDLLMRERIGVGTLLDACLLGKLVDLLNRIDLLQQPRSYALRIMLMVLGMTLTSLGQWLYMRVALSCGPQDSLLVGLSKRLRRVPIGLLNVGIMAVALLLALLLHGPIGLGTLLTVALQGPIMQLVFRVVRFVPREVEHEDVLTTLRHFGKRRISHEHP